MFWMKSGILCHVKTHQRPRQKVEAFLITVVMRITTSSAVEVLYVNTPSLHYVHVGQREYAQYMRKKSCYENKIRKQETQTLNILKVCESADDAACSK
jgi:hypothetical protein